MLFRLVNAEYDSDTEVLTSNSGLLTMTARR